MPINRFTCEGILGEDMGKMDAKRQCETLGPRLQALNSRSTTDFTTKRRIVVMVSGIGTRNTLWYPSITEVMTKVVRDMARLKVWRSPPRVRRPCFRPDWKALNLTDGDTKFQMSRR